MPLFFISLGLWDKGSIPLKALEVAKKCDKLFAELYTQPMNLTKEDLEKVFGKKVMLLTRSQLENEYRRILIEPAKSLNIGLLVGGDAFCATTHSTIRLEAMKEGVETKVVHSSSIFSAVAETGLHIYKFGKSVTVPFPSKFKTSLGSVYETIKMNLMNDLHTLILLDIDLEHGKFLKPGDALKMVLEEFKSRNDDSFNEESHVVVASKLGSDEAKIVYSKVRNLLQYEEVPSVIVIPGELHFTEREYLEWFRWK